MRMKISYRGYRFPVRIIENLQLAEALFSRLGIHGCLIGGRMRDPFLARKARGEGDRQASRRTGVLPRDRGALQTQNMITPSSFTHV